MSEIKFRGRDIDSGQFVYAELGDIMAGVRTDSVAQLVGYDKHGREVYEGDILQMDFEGLHYEYKARLRGFADNDNGCYITQKQFGNMELKED